MSHLSFSILAFFIYFWLLKSDLSDNTVWPQASGFQKLAKIDLFCHFYWTFAHSKCKRSLLRSQCWMRLFCDFQTTVAYPNPNNKEHLSVCLSVCSPFACNSGPTWPILMKLSWCNERKIFVKISRKSRENEDGKSVSNFPFSFGEPVVQFRYKSFFRQQQLNIENHPNSNLLD